MSTSADTTDTTKPTGTPTYRRRRRIYGGIAVVLVIVIVIALIIFAVTRTSGSGSAALPSFTIANSQGNVASSDSIVESQPSLAKTIPAHLHYVPFDAGVTAIAEMRSGTSRRSTASATPRDRAIGTNTGVVVVFAQSFDADALIVPPSITRPASSPEVGRRPCRLVGGLRARGWLGVQHLTGSVKVVGMASEQAVAAAYLARRGQGRLRVRGARSGADRQGRPPADQRPADRQAGYPGPQRRRGFRERWSAATPRSSRSTSAPRSRPPG